MIEPEYNSSNAIDELWNYIFHSSTNKNFIPIRITIDPDNTEFDYVHDRFNLRLVKERERISNIMKIKNKKEDAIKSIMMRAMRGFSGNTGNVNYIVMQLQSWNTSEIIYEYITKEEFSNVMKTLQRNCSEISLFDYTVMDENKSPKQIFSSISSHI